ncbi:hypothetical protein DV096_11280 [Bradymonadaceae bacterium TMQ3]|nr:hypothetical protein DV096_11280 [Bradymonadaceae bacterium TMQ3]TXC75520.1 M23 family metallopeptidase [Bradymonadales bacterium TMQ1]
MMEAEVATIIIGITLFAHLILAPILIAWVAFSRTNARLYWLLVTLFTASFLATMHVAGAGWSWFGLFWRWLFLALFVLAIGRFLRKRWSQLPWLPPKKVKPWLATLLVGLLAVYFLTSIPYLVSAGSHDGRTTELTWPLPDGDFFIMHGGGNEAVNHHYNVPAQRYGLDIVQLNDYGVRARGLLPPTLDAYAIYRTPVLAPCDGEVLAARNDLPDQKPMEMDPDNLLGNHLTIHCHDLTIVLAHLLEGTLRVDVGDHVRAGQPIAEVGNTGNTSEPHLHIHAVEGRVTDHDELAFKGKGRSMTFSGRFLQRNDRVDVR